MRRVTARYNWDRVRVSFWFAPAVMSLGAILLVWAMNWVDAHIPNEILMNSRLVLSGSAESQRGILVTMATSTLATAGVVFTLLTLPLSTVAAQYGSRLLRLFLGDRITQLVLGMFVGTFVYCIAAATSFPPVGSQSEAPQVVVTTGLLLMMATFGSLILLVQHISTMLQAPQIAAAAGAELLEVVRSEIQHEISSDAKQIHQRAPVSLDEQDGYPVRVRKTGYIQYIDPNYLLVLSRETNLVIRLLRKPGDFVWEGAAVAGVWSSSSKGGKTPPEDGDGVDQRLEKHIGRAFRIGKQRTPTQDVEYAVNQLVEMALRAMSPAINDPFTAMTCLDYLGQGLALLAQKGEETPNIYDEAGNLRMVFEPVAFDQLLIDAFDMLRHASCDNASLLLHILKVIERIGQQVISPDVCQKLRDQVTLIQAESQAGALIEWDRQIIYQRGESLKVKLIEISSIGVALS